MLNRVLRATGQTRFRSGAATRNSQRSRSFFQNLFRSGGGRSSTARTGSIVGRNITSRDSLRRR